jgi:hypothetical protein
VDSHFCDKRILLVRYFLFLYSQPLPSLAHLTINPSAFRNLAFCPFTPFIVILGTAILNIDYEDMNLLAQVVESLERASRQAPGATKLYNICRILLKGARSCIDQSLSAKPAATTTQMRTHDKKMPDYNQVAQNDESAQFGFSEDWDSVQLDHLGNMSTFV